jgi:hypothetical protein
VILKNFLDDDEIVTAGAATTGSMESTSIKASVSASLSFATTISFQCRSEEIDIPCRLQNSLRVISLDSHSLRIARRSFIVHLFIQSPYEWHVIGKYHVTAVAGMPASYWLLLFCQPRNESVRYFTVFRSPAAGDEAGYDQAGLVSRRVIVGRLQKIDQLAPAEGLEDFLIPIHELVKQLFLGIDQSINLFFQSPPRNELENLDVLILANPVNAVGRLIFLARVPPAVVVDHYGSSRQIDTNPACQERTHKDFIPIGHHLALASDKENVMEPASILAGRHDKSFVDTGDRNSFSFGANRNWPHWALFAVDVPGERPQRSRWNPLMLRTIS